MLFLLLSSLIFLTVFHLPFQFHQDCLYLKCFEWTCRSFSVAKGITLYDAYCTPKNRPNLPRGYCTSFPSPHQYSTCCSCGYSMSTSSHSNPGKFKVGGTGSLSLAWILTEKCNWTAWSKLQTGPHCVAVWLLCPAFSNFPFSNFL